MILLTGGSGFVGRALRGQLAGEDVLGVTRQPNPLHEDIACDLSEQHAATRIERELEARGVLPTRIVHLAGVTPWADSPDYGADLDMARTLTRLCSALKVPRLLYLSGWVVYDPTFPAPYREDAPLGPSSPYGASKLAVERELAAIDAATQVVLLRASSIYGPGQTSAGLIPNLVTAGLSGGPLILQGRVTKRDYVHVSDVVRAIAQLCSLELDSPLTTLNIGGGRSFSVTEIARAVQHACRAHVEHDIPLEFVPHAVEGEPADNLLSIDRALDLGLLSRPMTIDEGIRGYVDWRHREDLL